MRNRPAVSPRENEDWLVAPRVCAPATLRPMLVLFDTPAGHALFKVLKPAALEKPESLWDAFSSLDTTNKMCASPCWPLSLPGIR